ncbi:MAG TPA: L,D-transpeptidase family protein [Chloroflexota bacterium]
MSYVSGVAKGLRRRATLLPVAAVLVALLLSAGTSTPAHADDRFGVPWQSMVVVNQATVYSKPELSSPPVGPLGGGAIVVVTGDKLGDDHGWTQIISGYIRSSDITELRGEWVAEVAVPSVSLYALPGPSGGILRTAKQGDLVRVTGVSSGVDGNNDIWWCTTTGYAALNALKFSTSEWARSWSPPNSSLAANGWWGQIASETNVRAGATTKSPVVGTFGGGERIKVLAEEQGETVAGSNKWYVIDGGRYAGGRVHSSLVRKIAAPKANLSLPASGRAPSYIVVDRAAFSLTLVRDNQPVFVTYVALGKAGVDTPAGTYSTFGKFTADRMTSRSVKGATHSYDLANVPFTEYYKDGGYAIHGTYWHDLYGTRESQGCINLTWADSAYLFNLTAPRVPDGSEGMWQNGEATPVVIVD